MGVNDSKMVKVCLLVLIEDVKVGYELMECLDVVLAITLEIYY